MTHLGVVTVCRNKYICSYKYICICIKNKRYISVNICIYIYIYLVCLKNAGGVFLQFLTLTFVNVVSYLLFFKFLTFDCSVLFTFPEPFLLFFYIWPPASPKPSEQTLFVEYHRQGVVPSYSFKKVFNTFWYALMQTWSWSY